MSKDTPAWQTRGLAEAPPIVRGYHHYGTVYSPEQGSQREGWRYAWTHARWSWWSWGKKVQRDIRAVRAEGGRGTLRGNALDQLGLTVFAVVVWLHRPRG